jgi:Zn-dependent M28 family amino/carboxypeptidase
MKKVTFIIALILFTLGSSLSAQNRFQNSEKFGGTLNLGLGIGGYYGYYGYYSHTSPVLNINYEFGVARNFTLAPFLTFYSYTDGNYREVVTPIGVKATYYFDQILHAGPRWDFYAAGSLGAALVSTTWDANYYGDRTYYRSIDPIYLDFHVGTEYHFSNHIGGFLDLSTGVSTIGIAIH